VRNSADNVVDLIAHNAIEISSVLDRIKARKNLLKRWVDVGVPAAKLESLPNSLRSAREWSDPEIGIFAIGSPNSFTKTHPVWGRDVAEVGALLHALKNKYRRPPKRKRSTDRTVVAKIDTQEAERQLQIAVSQWHMERAKAEREKRRADAAEGRTSLLLAENARKDEEISDLRRLIAQRSTRFINEVQ
jgi:hypothetical protein